MPIFGPVIFDIPEAGLLPICAAFPHAESTQSSAVEEFRIPRLICIPAGCCCLKMASAQARTPMSLGSKVELNSRCSFRPSSENTRIGECRTEQFLRSSAASGGLYTITSGSRWRNERFRDLDLAFRINHSCFECLSPASFGTHHEIKYCNHHW